MGRGCLPSGNVVVCFCIAECSVDELFMHYFHNLSSALGAWPQTSTEVPYLCSQAPNLPTPGKNPVGHHGGNLVSYQTPYSTFTVSVVGKTTESNLHPNPTTNPNPNPYLVVVRYGSLALSSTCSTASFLLIKNQHLLASLCITLFFNQLPDSFHCSNVN